jgi:hypothetical protein
MMTELWLLFEINYTSKNNFFEAVVSSASDRRELNGQNTAQLVNL